MARQSVSRKPANRKSDARRRITEACAALMETVDFDEITVSDLIREARISRSTFYYHFSNMQEVLEALMGAFFDAFTETVSIKESFIVCQNPNSYIKGRSIVLMEYLSDNRTLLRAILSSSYRLMFCEHLARIFIDAYSRVGHYVDGVRLSQRDQKYQDYMMAYQTVAGFLCWYERDFRESPKEYVDLVYRLCVPDNMEMRVE